MAVPDGTRAMDVGAVLHALAPRLGSRATAIVGLGLHRRMAGHELPRSPIPLVQHDPDDVVPTATIDGIPGAVARACAEAEVVLGVGVVELHQYAGFSGGHKAVAVGCGGRATIDALHHRDRVTAPGVALGRLAGNPFRDTIDALGRAARCTWCLLSAGERWVAGEPGAALAEAAAQLRCWIDVPRRYAQAVVRVRGPKAASFYQASRAYTYLALSDAPPLLPGAPIVLDAPCPESLGLGSGEIAFASILRSTPAPWSALLDGPAPSGGGTQRAIMLALAMRRHPLVLAGLDDPRPFERLGIPVLATAPADAPGTLVVPSPFTALPRLALL